MIWWIHKYGVRFPGEMEFFLAQHVIDWHSIVHRTCHTKRDHKKLVSYLFINFFFPLQFFSRLFIYYMYFFFASSSFLLRLILFVCFQLRFVRALFPLCLIETSYESYRLYHPHRLHWIVIQISFQFCDFIFRLFFSF